MKHILITGAAKQIGVALRKGLRGFYSLVRLLDVAPLGKAEGGEEVIIADIRDVAAMEKAMEGIDCVVHLAGASVESRWDKVLPLEYRGLLQHVRGRATSRRQTGDLRKLKPCRWLSSARAVHR
jgi:uronate dehydrogenase